MTRPNFALLLSAGIACGLVFHAPSAAAQISATDLLVRLDQLENQVRQLTGTLEQLQYRNQQLEQALRRMQEDNEFRFQELGSKGQARPAAPRQGAAPSIPQSASANMAPSNLPPPNVAPPPSLPPSPPPGLPPSGRQSDAFDPLQNPTAPGAPRTLGSMAATAGGEPIAPSAAPGGRLGGAPLDITTLAGNSANASGAEGSALPPPPPRNPNATGAIATLPPTQAPRDEYDLAYGYMLRKDYAQAEEGFRVFLRKYPSDPKSGEAQYWLGESLFQRHSYRDAADVFLTMTKKHEHNPKAAEALLRLGQSLAALHEKELACATFGEVARKYPRAGPTTKQAVEREQKRAGC